MVVSTILKKPECFFIYSVDECGVDSVQISKCYTPPLERDLHALDILPQCDNMVAMVELRKVNI
jgi:hypothetical protein